MLFQRQAWLAGGPARGGLTLQAAADANAQVHLANTVSDASPAALSAGYSLTALPNVLTVQVGTISVPSGLLGTAGWYSFLYWGPLGIYEEPARHLAKMMVEVDPSVIVYARVIGDELDLWVAVTRRDEMVETAAAEKFCNLIEAYPGFSLDYMLLEQGAETERLVSEYGYREMTAAAP